MTGSAGPPAGGAGPLAGLRVVELGGIGPAPFCGMVLADLGADVTRVNRPGDDQRRIHPVLDRGKRSVVVDLRDPAAAAALRRYAADADVVIEGFRPGVAERLGLGPDDLLADHPALVYGRMTGYGQDGPLARRAGHDINYIALSGVLGAVGRAGGPPTPPLNLVGDFGGGGMLLALGVLAATLNARATGRGQVVDAAMVDGSALLMAMVHGFHGRGEWTLERGTNLLDSGAPFYDTYVCADGGHVAVGAIEAPFFASLVATLGIGDRVDVTRQLDRAYWPHVRAVLGQVFATEPRDHWAVLFRDLDACVTPVLDLQEATRDDHNVARAVFLHTEHGTAPAPAPRFSVTPCPPPAPAPTLGEHDHLLTDPTARR